MATDPLTLEASLANLQRDFRELAKEFPALAWRVMYDNDKQVFPLVGSVLADADATKGHWHDATRRLNTLASRGGILLAHFAQAEVSKKAQLGRAVATEGDSMRRWALFLFDQCNGFFHRDTPPEPITLGESQVAFIMFDAARHSARAVDYLINTLVGRGPNDGPACDKPKQFIWQGKTYTFTKRNWQLLCCLWGRSDGVDFLDIGQEVWGEETRNGTIKSQITRLNEQLSVKHGLPFSVETASEIAYLVQHPTAN